MRQTKISFLDEMYNQSARGVICIFSLKNPSYPEYCCWAEAGVMCIDFHHQVGLAQCPVVDVVGAAPPHGGSRVAQW